MDYLQRFKAEAEKRGIGRFFKQVSDLENQLPKVTRRLEAEKGNRDNLEGRLKKLDELSMESLSEQNAYEKYKVSMRKLKAELEVSQEIIDNIEKRVLPAAKGKLQDGERNLKIVLYQVAHESRKAADTEAIEPAMRALIAEIDKQQDAVARGFQDFGQNYIANDEGLIPGIWPSQELNDLKVRLGMLPATGLSFVEVWKLAHPEPAVESPRPVRIEPVAEEALSKPDEADEPPTPSLPSALLPDTGDRLRSEDFFRTNLHSST